MVQPSVTHEERALEFYQGVLKLTQLPSREGAVRLYVALQIIGGVVLEGAHGIRSPHGALTPVWARCAAKTASD